MENSSWKDGHTVQLSNGYYVGMPSRGTIVLEQTATTALAGTAEDM